MERLDIMHNLNKLPQIKFHITLYLVFITFLLLCTSTQKDSHVQETHQSVPFFPSNVSFQDHYFNFQELY